MSNDFYQDKFVAFIDILGFKNIIESSAANGTPTVNEIREMLARLERKSTIEQICAEGPPICPCSNRVSETLQFQVTQTSDCSVISAEISPAGAINLLQHCWSVAFSLLKTGHLVRGYITRGELFHEGQVFFGPGYHAALTGEKDVRFQSEAAGYTGTPFIEIDTKFVSYVRNVADPCVETMFSRLVAECDSGFFAIFPFLALQHEFAIGKDFYPAKEREQVEQARNWIRSLQILVQLNAPDDIRSQKKTRSYLDALKTQMQKCDEIDEMIHLLLQSISDPSPYTLRGMTTGRRS